MILRLFLLMALALWPQTPRIPGPGGQNGAKLIVSTSNGTATNCATCSSNALANITSAAGNTLYVDVFSQSSVNAVSNGTDTFDIATTCTNSSNVACVENFNGWTGSGGYQHWLYCLPSTSIAGSNTVTVTLAGSSANFTVNYTAIFAGSCKLDSGATPTCTGSATFGTTVSCTSALALNASTDFVIATVNHSGTPTVASPWALLTAASPNTLKLIDVYQLSPASGTQNNNFATSGGSNSWNVMAVAFQ